MAELSPRDFPSDLQRLYARLSRQDIEEFYAGYQLWQARQRATVLQRQIEVLRRQIVANAERMQLLQPSEQALAVLNTLRHYGIADLDLLDQLLERGEAWLVRMLDYLEQCRSLGLFDGDYTRWCQHALEGAYDWLASIGEEAPAAQEAALPPAEEGAAEPVLTEEEFLRRLAHEETAPLPGASESPAPPALSEEASSAPQAVPLPSAEDSLSPAARPDAAGGAAVEESANGTNSSAAGPADSAETGQDAPRAETMEMAEAVAAGEQGWQEAELSSDAMQHSPRDEAEALPPSQESGASSKPHPWRRFFGRRAAN